MRLRIFLALIVAPPVLAGAQSNPPVDPEAATEAYLATVPDADRERSDAYFEGGYWLQLIGFLYGLGVAWILLVLASFSVGDVTLRLYGAINCSQINARHPRCASKMGRSTFTARGCVHITNSKRRKHRTPKAATVCS